MLNANAFGIETEITTYNTDGEQNHLPNSAIRLAFGRALYRARRPSMVSYCCVMIEFQIHVDKKEVMNNIMYTY